MTASLPDRRCSPIRYLKEDQRWGMLLHLRPHFFLHRTSQLGVLQTSACFFVVRRSKSVMIYCSARSEKSAQEKDGAAAKMAAFSAGSDERSISRDGGSADFAAIENGLRNRVALRCTRRRRAHSHMSAFSGREVRHQLGKLTTQVASLKQTLRKQSLASALGRIQFRGLRRSMINSTSALSGIGEVGLGMESDRS